MTTQVKKAYVELVELLKANEGKKVSSIMDDVMALVTSQNTTKTFYKDSEGNVVAVYCYYHKKWELVSHMPYGSKANSATGLNTMCKEGTSMWTKQQRTFKKAKEELLTKVASGEIDPSTINEALEELSKAKDVIVPSIEEHGFDTLEEALASIN